MLAVVIKSTNDAKKRILSFSEWVANLYEFVQPQSLAAYVPLMVGLGENIHVFFFFLNCMFCAIKLYKFIQNHHLVKSLCFLMRWVEFKSESCIKFMLR